MTELAFFSDVHGNAAALRAVLADIPARRVAGPSGRGAGGEGGGAALGIAPEDAPVAYCLGDLVGYGPDPNGVIDLVRDAGLPAILGNYDEGIAFDREGCGCYYPDDESRRIGDASFGYTAAAVTAERKAWLRSLPRELRLEVAGLRLRLLHGSPRRINEYLSAGRDERTYRRLAPQADADVLLFGHTHLPWHKEYGGVLFVNVGSAGRPKDGDARAMYTVLRLDEGRPPEIAVRRVAYDVEATARGVLAAGLPVELAHAFRRGA